MTPGIHPGVNYQAYAAAPGIRHSHLREARRSMAHMREKMIRPSAQTDAQFLGTGLHTALLEPQAYARDYVTMPERWDKRTKVGKAAYEAWNAEHAQQTSLLPEEGETIESVVAAVASNQTASDLLSAPGLIEASAFWLDHETGEPCKCRVDKICTFAGYTWVIDIKSTRNASEGAFGYAVDDFSYHTAAAFYLDGLSTIAPHPRRHVLIAVEKEPPYALACYELDDEALEVGRQEYRGWLRAYKQAKDSGIWPAYPDGIQPLRLPIRTIKRAAALSGKEIAA